MRMFQKMSVRTRLARCFQAGALCALSLCALPQYAHARQANSVPVLSDLPVIGKLYRVEPKTPAQPKVVGGQEAGSQIVSLEARSATLGQVIELLMDQAHLSYTLDPTLEKLPVGSLKLRKVPFLVALRTLLKSAAGRATYTFEDGIYRILPHENPDAERQTPAAPSPGVSATPEGGDPKAGVRVSDAPVLDADKKITLDFDNVPLASALKLMFAQNQLNHTVTIDPTLLNYHITAHLKNLDARSALEQALKSAGNGVTYRVENGVYQIVPKPKDNSEGVKP